jgi:hypothetical protein
VRFDSAVRQTGLLRFGNRRETDHDEGNGERLHLFKISIK